MYTTTLREQPLVPMTVEEFVAHQGSSAFHAYTCGNDSSHDPLFIVENVDPMYLACPDCWYIQDTPKRPAKTGDVITINQTGLLRWRRELTLTSPPKRTRQQNGCKVNYTWEVKGELVPLEIVHADRPRKWEPDITYAERPQRDISFKEKIRSVNFGSVK